ncbi:NAD(P)H-hydrate dehydratase [Acidimangrovimonas sediminis]|uniref:NAD(P)H-hydrate dehydratase n=1 Tax=Acidimangrovimonas sediminis TaxID=2056283 RepID=UPI000C809897|nr:NAD(P)H-hydrate dehydratase [Acidimangrovimonas sediminis]
MREPAGETVLTAAAMRAEEAAAIGSGAVTGRELMERAGAGVVEALLSRWPEFAADPGRALVLCGPGNNGGDGYVVARLLHGRGWAVELFALGDLTALPPDAAANTARWRDLGDIHPLDPEAVADLETLAGGAVAGGAGIRAPDLVIDALFGTGLSRPLSGVALAGLRAAAASGAPLVAVDILSGLCADSGRVLGKATLPEAALTVTFHRAKPGHFLADGAVLSGRVEVADIGLAPLDDAAEDSAGGSRLAAPAVGRLGKAVAAHKYGHGHALVLAGGPGHGGAARLAARGALRTGAGLVTLGCTKAAMAENAAQLTAIMLRDIGGPMDLGEVLEDRRLSAVCLGPGLGVGEATRALVATALSAGPAVVLDADALTSFAETPDRLFEAVASHRSSGGVVLTPHGGEFARLFPDLAGRLATPAETGPAWSRLDAARAAARRSGAVVLLKGADTVIAAPEGRARIHAATGAQAAPWLATAGAGDVLAGFITGLLARGFDPLTAAESAAWLHAACARSFGPGLIAEDLPEELPRVFRGLGL